MPEFNISPPELSMVDTIRDYLISIYTISGRSYDDIAEIGGVSKSTVYKFLNHQTKSVSLDVLEGIMKGLGKSPADVFADAYGYNKHDVISEAIADPDDDTRFRKEVYEQQIAYERDMREISRSESAYHKKEIGRLGREIRLLTIEKWIYFGVMMVILFAVIAYLVWDVNSPDVGIFRSMMLGV